MPIQIWSDRIWLAQLGNEPILSEDLMSLRERAGKADPTPDMVLDFSEVSHLNSSNLSQLLRIRKLAIDREVRLLLAAPTDSVWAVFLTTGLDKVFEFVVDVPTSLAGLQVDRQPESDD